MPVVKPPQYYLTQASPTKDLEIQFKRVSTALLVGTVHLDRRHDFKNCVRFIIIVRRNDPQRFFVRMERGNRHLDRIIVTLVLSLNYVHNIFVAGTG